MATIDEFVLKNIGLWWRYGISRHCDEWKYIIIGRIFESEIMLIPPSLKISEGSYNGSYRNTDEVWWRYGISRSCDEWCTGYVRQSTVVICTGYVRQCIVVNIVTMSHVRKISRYQKGFIRSCKSKDRQGNNQKKNTKDKQ
jgi:hypothetical protein